MYSVFIIAELVSVRQAALTDGCRLPGYFFLEMYLRFAYLPMESIVQISKDWILIHS